MDWGVLLGKITFPFLGLFGEDINLGTIWIIYFVISWIAAILIMKYYDGDWGDFFRYLIWANLVSMGLSLLIVPGVLIWVYFAGKHGIINAFILLLGPIGWALGASWGLYE